MGLSPAHVGNIAVVVELSTYSSVRPLQQSLVVVVFTVVECGNRTVAAKWRQRTGDAPGPGGLLSTMCWIPVRAVLRPGVIAGVLMALVLASSTLAGESCCQPWSYNSIFEPGNCEIPIEAPVDYVRRIATQKRQSICRAGINLGRHDGSAGRSDHRCLRIWRAHWIWVVLGQDPYCYTAVAGAERRRRHPSVPPKMGDSTLAERHRSISSVG